MKCEVGEGVPSEERAHQKVNYSRGYEEREEGILTFMIYMYPIYDLHVPKCKPYFRRASEHGRGKRHMESVTCKAQKTHRARTFKTVQAGRQLRLLLPALRH